MDSLPSEKLLQSIELTHNGSRYILHCEGNTYAIGEILYILLIELKKHTPLHAVYNRLTQEYHISEQEVDQVLKERLQPLIEKLETIPESRKKSSSYIYFRKIILKASIVEFLSKFLKVLFYKPCFIILSITALVLNMIYGYLITQTPVHIQPFSIQGIIFLYGILMAIMLFHELGHAAAAYKLGKKPNEIGFGFYFLFPVLFADVTSVWSLSKYNRILVNMGGIYFQLLANIPLIIAFLLLGEVTYKNIIYYLITTNWFVIAYSLLPFLRNDGYWIYSDFFDLPNLMKNANAYPATLYRKLKRNTTSRADNLWTFIKEIPLLLFSIGNYSFMIFILYVYFKLLLAAVSDIQTLFNMANISYTNLIDYAGLVLKIIFFIGIFIITMTHKVGQLKKIFYPAHNP